MIYQGELETLTRSDGGITPTGVELSDLISRFLTLADALDMSVHERAGIVGVAPEDWPNWPDENDTDLRRAELVRRLRYALPLMQRSLENAARPH